MENKRKRYNDFSKYKKHKSSGPNQNGKDQEPHPNSQQHDHEHKAKHQANQTLAPSQSLPPGDKGINPDKPKHSQNPSLKGAATHNHADGKKHQQKQWQHQGGKFNHHHHDNKGWGKHFVSKKTSLWFRDLSWQFDWN
jgi:hypothetical protein